MLPVTQSAFFDELEKISSDLMNPAVVSDSAIVDGPPPTPFTRRKGFRKLEKFGPVKEAAAADWIKRGVKKARRVGRVLRHGAKHPGAASGVLYEEIPKPLRAIGESLLDPNSIANPSPFTRIFTG